MTEKTSSLVFSAQYVALVHTICSFAAFFIPLALALYTHYYQVVKNEFYGYPEEWFPSVSATIGDWYPERSVFQWLIALTATPRLLVLLLWFTLSGISRPSVIITTALGVLRTALCGGWVYVTSTDDHDWHDIFMIGYLISNAPWFILVSKCSPVNSMASRIRNIGSALFVLTIFPLIYWYIQHKFKHIPGAYTVYAFFEWSLILWDILFDSALYWDFKPLVFNLHTSKTYSNPSSFATRKKEKGEHLSYAEAAAVGTQAKNIKKDSNVKCSKKQILFSLLYFSSEVYLSFVFWSVLTSLGLLVWYFPLWHMGISGYEACILFELSPFLLGIPLLRKFASKVPVIFLFLNVIGIAAYKLEDPVHRLFVTAFSVCCECLAWTSLFSNISPENLAIERKISTFLFGLLASSIAKYSFFSNNPIWPILNETNGGKQIPALIVGIIACLIFAIFHVQQTTANAVEHFKLRKITALSAALSLGTVLFCLHTFLCDSTVLMTWSWDGYPIKGPQPYPHGAVSIVVSICAVLVAPYLYQSGAFMLIGFVLACFGSYFMYINHGWCSYLGGLIFTSYVLIYSFASIRISSFYSPAKVWGGAFLVYILYSLAHVWVVAYEFVPGGPILRERTSYILIFIGWNLAALVPAYSGESKEPNKADSSVVDIKQSDSSYRRRSFKKSLLTGFCLALMALKFAIQNMPPYDYTPYHPNEKLFTAGIWTIHFGLDNFMYASENRIRDAVRDMELDVFGLLESDTQRLIMGFRDLTQVLAHDLGMYADYGPGPDKHTWGAALLSKFPIVNSTHHLLPSPQGELAPAIHATLDVYGELIDVVVSHNGQYESQLDRRLQSTELARIMRESPRPLVFLGYVVSNVGQEPQTILTRDTGMLDIEPADYDRWCQYIFYRGVKRIGYARLHRSTITDTELQTGKFLVTKDLGRNVRIDKEHVPESHRYPSLFEGTGVNGHYYDNNLVVHEPWYYD
ncbi:glycosylceramide biosynthesis protein Cwh43 [Schizosaccharomyces pombe]|uniref:Protein cwh43 n=1 Tax=Schizosaccharomyces pombe (strain 972 / ATCC 24843) TaxID=284812 RepID=CWH43_SCHPO|nr:putative glycosylceramide biosynthesis protein [Schizosaccharomyces pombe]Q9HDZ2.2 RecName: Full=Protein cwh43 [Schizosaccharomyces pombe 972h-]CAC19769.2 glycosylceramide biosynthesis protein (predicted) [Schizosaccharomyces pombe]|eukprot:NP_594060.2 putative glycosylceramide biosynthesis protein [Schizosaccharomyces pombe]